MEGIQVFRSPLGSGLIQFLLVHTRVLVATSHCLALSGCWHDHFVKLFTGRGSRKQRVRFEAKNTGGRDRKKPYRWRGSDISEQFMIIKAKWHGVGNSQMDLSNMHYGMMGSLKQEGTTPENPIWTALTRRNLIHRLYWRPSQKSQLPGLPNNFDQKIPWFRRSRGNENSGRWWKYRSIPIVSLRNSLRVAWSEMS